MLPPLLIIKIVNASGKTQLAELNIEAANKIDSRATLISLQNDDLEAENSFDLPAVIVPKEKTIAIKGKSIHVELNKYSLSVIRVGLF
jgi:alpha-L-arabinofuranosidase